MFPTAGRDMLSYGLPADVFSFGLMTWQLSNWGNDAPWRDIPDEALTEAVRNGTKLDPLPFASCPGWLQRLASKCMEVDESRRPTMSHIVVSATLA
jgi:hypothetical protein